MSVCILNVLAKTLMDIVVSQYGLQEITITFILKIICQSSVFMVLFRPTNSLKPKDNIFLINDK